MKIESIVYEEKYIDLEDAETVKTIDRYLIKPSGEIYRELDGKAIKYNKARPEDFMNLERDVVEFIAAADHTVYFFDNMLVTIIISYENGTKQIVERGLACGDDFFDSIIESYLDEYGEE